MLKLRKNLFVSICLSFILFFTITLQNAMAIDLHASADENFSSSANWKTLESSWFITNNSFYAYPKAPTYEAKVAFSDSTYSDMSLEIDLKGDLQKSADYGVLFKATKLADYINGYYTGIDSNGNLFLVKYYNKTWTSLSYVKIPSLTLLRAITPITSNLPTRAHLKIVTSGNNIKIYLNNSTTPIIDVNDATIGSGSVILKSYKSMVSFSNFKLTTDPAKFNVSIVNKQTNLFLTSVPNPLASSTQSTYLYNNTGTKDQQWHFSYVGDGYYKISDYLNNNLSAIYLNKGAPVYLAPSNPNPDTQLWKIQQNSDGSVYVVPKSAPFAITSAPGRGTSTVANLGSNITYTNEQLWEIK